MLNTPHSNSEPLDQSNPESSGNLSTTDEGLTTSINLLARLDDTSDQQAWNRFVKTYSPYISNWCRKFGLQDSDSADVTQNVLMKLVGFMHEFQYRPERGSFRGWLKTITSNLVRDVLRSQKVGARASGSDEAWQQLANIQDPQAVHELAAVIQRGYEEEILSIASQRVRSRVQDKTWQAYVGTAVDGQSAQQIATRLKITVSDVYVSKSRVIKMLRAEVAKLDQ